MTDIELRQPGELESVMTIPDLVGQVGLIQEAMRAVMREGEHFGTIPGTDKPTLLKAGAEKLALLLRLNPQYTIISSTHNHDLIHYVVRCTLVHIPSGNEIASGMGACNTRETKYRYRFQPTGEDPPNKAEQERLKLLGTHGFRKIKGQWAWCERTEADPYEYDNTVLKMASKRAFVAAMLAGAAASDIFAQDLEDLPGYSEQGSHAPLPAELQERLVKTVTSAGQLEPTLWSVPVVLANAQRKFGRKIERLADLTEPEALAIIGGAEKFLQRELAKAEQDAEAEAVHDAALASLAEAAQAEAAIQQFTDEQGNEIPFGEEQ